MKKGSGAPSLILCLCHPAFCATEKRHRHILWPSPPRTTGFCGSVGKQVALYGVLSRLSIPYLVEIATNVLQSLALPQKLFFSAFCGRFFPGAGVPAHHDVRKKGAQAAPSSLCPIACAYRVSQRLSRHQYSNTVITPPILSREAVYALALPVSSRVMSLPSSPTYWR